ncbi:MAG: SPOR domain-containing protein, partial [Deltaproteobacteria bacterium]|nr:SPOR domain-containing protein [Deltaproteobacteria bacterium]
TAGMIEECYNDLSLEGSFLRLEEKESKPPSASRSIGRRRRKVWKWAAAIFLLAGGVGFGMTGTGRDLINRYRSVISIDISRPPSNKSEIAPIPGHAVTEPGVAQRPNPLKEPVKIEPSDSPAGNPVSTEVREEAVGSGEVKPVIVDPEPMKTVIVKRGDTLLELATKIYGYADENILKRVQNANPDLVDIDRIEIGQKILFPLLSRSADQSPVYSIHIASFRPFESARKLYQRMLSAGHEAYIIPFYSQEKGKVFRVTLGSFKTRREAEAYAAAIRRKGISAYAEVIQLETR